MQSNRKDKVPYHNSYDKSERKNPHRSDRNYDRRSYSRGRYNRSTYRNQHYRNGPRPHWSGYNHRNQKEPYRKVQLQRSPSPAEGTDEYMNRKVQQTSASIMRHILSGDNVPIPIPINNHELFQESANQCNDLTKTKPVRPQKAKHKKARANFTAKEIHKKIMNHIMNLNDGKKKNFINSSNKTGLDDAVHHINLQKKVEISRILRDMNAGTKKNTDNLIIPDLGIDLNQLPQNVIDELTQTLNIDLDSLKEEFDPPGEIYNIEETNTPIDSRELLNLYTHVQSFNVEHNMMHQDTESNQIDYQEEAGDSNPKMPQQIILQSECTGRQQSSAEHVEMNDGLVQEVLSNIINCVDLTNEHEEVWVDKGNNYETCSVTIKEEPTAELESTLIIKDEPTEEVLDSEIGVSDVKIEVVEKYDVQMDCDDQLTYKENANMRQLLKTTMKTIEIDKKIEIVNGDINVEKIKLIDLCMLQLYEYKNNLLFSKPKVKHKENDKTKDGPILTFPYVKTQITAIVVTETEIALSTKSGHILFVDKLNGNLIRSLDLSRGIITSMIPVVMNKENYIFAGCIQNSLFTCNLTQKDEPVKCIGVAESIYCMVAQWDFVFMGCKNGTLIRYSCARQKVEYVEKNLGNDILVIKAMQEGPRKVLLMGHRQSPIYVRDAFSGLHLRSFSDIAITPTVYSIVVTDGNLYCGTAKDNVLVFSFYEAALKFKIVLAECVGISCMTIYQRMLFVGCYNGLIYIYDLDQKRLLTSFQGPGGSIICMEVLRDQILVGTFTNFQSLSLPKECKTVTK